MDVSRILFTKETKERINKPLTVTEKGKLRWQRIKDAEASGELSLAKNRYEIGRIAGYENKNQAYSWASNCVSRGHISETFLGIDRANHASYEYHVIGEPDFDRKKSRAAKMSAKREKSLKEPVVKQPITDSVKDKKRIKK